MMEVSRVFFIISYSLDDFSIHVLKQLQGIVSGDNNYIAIVTEDNPLVEGTLFNSWLKCVAVPITPPTPLSRQPTHRCITAGELSDLFERFNSSGDTNVPQNSNSSALVSNNTHYLLDNTPWSNECFVLMNTVVVVPNSSSMQLSVDTYGALLRVRTWSNSSIYCVSGDDHDSNVSDSNDTSSITWNDLSTSLPAFIGPMNSRIVQTLSSSIIWKGPMLIPEFRTKSSPTPPSLVLPGLQMLMNDSYPAELCRAVGMDFSHTHQPSYLELVQVVNVADIPSVWFSPLTVELSVDPSFERTPSANLLNQLFFSVTNPLDSQGVLVRLFMKGLNDSSSQQCKNTTTEWQSHILEREPTNGIQLSSSISCSSNIPGPLLLLLPCTLPSESCDARLLWKPEALSNVMGTFKRLLLSNEGESNHEEMLEDNIRCDPAHSVDHHGDDLAHDTDSVPNEIIALRTLETITRKRVKRKSTSELMLGGLVAPPIINVSTITPKDMLDCFTDTGMSTRDLSPVAMNSEDGSCSLHMITPEPSRISYKNVLGSTPHTAWKYHGVNYCFTDEDINREDKLTTLQSRYITRERSSNCFSYQSPAKDMAKFRIRKKPNKSINQTSLPKSGPVPQTECDSHSTQRHSQSKNKEGLIRRKRNVKNRTQSTTTVHSRKSINSNTHPRSKTVRSHSQTSQPRFCSTATSKNSKNSEFETRTNSVHHETMSGKRKRKGRLINNSNRENQSDSLNMIETIANKYDISPSHKKRKESITLDNSSVEAKVEVVNDEGLTTPPTCNQTATNTVTDDEGIVTNTDDSVINVSKEETPCTEPPSNCSKKCSGNNDVVSSRNAKKLLEKSVVNVLKDHGLTKGHARFNKCYIRLFKICKIYVLDLPTKSLSNMKKEITKIVESNIQQVIDFELQQNYTCSS